MAFAGYLLKINGTVFPNNLISQGGYKVTPNQRQDLDPYRDVVGLLHRNVLPHTPTKIELSTKFLHLEDKTLINQLLAGRDRMRIEYWNDETNRYETGTFYSPDTTYTYYKVDEELRDIMYEPIRIAFIEY